MKQRLVAVFALALVSLLTAPALLRAQDAPSRFFHSGDGKIHLTSARSKAAFNGLYRKADGSCDDAAMRKINAVFGARYGAPAASIPPRFVEFLDFLQDRLSPGQAIAIVSGYRSPTYNTKLREAGKLAAKASLHQYAMAADLKLGSAPSETVWNFIKELGFGGAGYYHGGLVHIDVGPARSWDETTSGVGTDISEENKLIAAVTDRDIYRPGESADLQIIRMTAYPVGVAPEVVLERIGQDGAAKTVGRLSTSLGSTGSACPQSMDIPSLAGIRWTLPADAAPGRYRLRIAFCDRQWEAMPAEIVTPEFEVRTNDH